MTKTAPLVGRDPSPVYKPRRSSRTLARALPVPLRTAEVSSLSAHESPFETSYPAAAMRARAVTPASNQVAPLFATHFVQVAKWISASAWKFGPRARIREAALGRGCVLSATSGGIET